MGKLFNAIKYAVTILIIVFLLTRIDFNSLLNYIKSTNPITIVFAIALFLLAFFIGVLNIYVFILAIGKPNLKELTQYTAISYSLGLLTPGRIGELSWAYWAKKFKISIGEALAIGILDKLITLITMGFIALFGFFLYFPFEVALKLSLIIIFGGIFVLLVIFLPFGRKLITKLLGKRAKDFNGFFATITKFILHHKIAVLSNLILTILKLLVSAMLFWILLNVPIGEVILITTVGTLISWIPISISGLGLREGAAVALYSAKGVPIEAVIGAYVISNAINYAFATITLVLLSNKIRTNS